VNDGPAAVDLTLGGNISDGSATGSITKTGTGTMLIQPPSGSLYTGATNVKDGVLETNSPVTASIPSGGLTIGDGVGAPGSAVVKTLAVADITTGTTVNRDGLLDADGHGSNLPGLTVNDGEVRLGSASMFVNVLSMTGGTINGTGSLSIAPLAPANLPPTMTVTSSPSGPAHLAYTGITFVNATTTLTVTPGSGAPDFVLEKGVQIEHSSHLVKQGGGTALFKGSSPPQGVIDVQAGTLDVAGFLASQFTVSPGATLTGKGTIGSTVVNGTLAPGAPKLKVSGDLAFGASGSLRVAVPSAVAAEAPSVGVTGAVNIASGAGLDLGIASGVTLPANTKLPLITNDAADAITGQFGNAPAGQFTESGGRSLTLSYAGGDGNDLDATVDAATGPPPGKPLVLSLTAARRQRFVSNRKLRVRVTCSTRCAASLVASVKPPGKSPKTSTAPPVRATIAPGKPVTITVRVPKAARAAILSALRAHRKVVVRVRVTARDAKSRASAAPRTVRITLTR
jgi:autotransporter-associated beta strand protein